MEEKKSSFFEDTQDLLEEYISNRLQLIKMQTSEKSAKLVSLVFTGLVIALLSFFILLFVSIMAGYYFAEVTHSQFYGFGIVAAFYVILLLVILFLRKRFLDKYISEMVVKIFFESMDEEDTHETK